MNNDYETTVRESYARMRVEELLERQRGGGLTQEALTWLNEELAKRNLSESDQQKILVEIEAEERELSGIPPALGQVELATPLRRLFAHIVDHAIALSILFGGDFFDGPSDVGIGLFAGVIGYFAYYLLSDALPGGASLGKRLLGMWVVGLQTHKPCGVKQAFMRNIPMFIPIVGLLDIIAIFGARNQRLGDRWAQTIVVRRQLTAQ